jgi:hypothetical protein
MKNTNMTNSRTVQLDSKLGDPVVESRLRAVLRNALRDAIGLSVVGLVACSSPSLGGDGGGGDVGATGTGNKDGGTTPIITTGACKAAVAAFDCTVAEYPPKIGMLNPPTKPDYMALHIGASVEVSAGQPCSASTNPEKCETAINAAILRAPPPVDSGVPPFFGASPEPRYLLARKGNAVTVFTTSDEAAKFLAPIDTAAEALLVAGFWQRLNTECSPTTGISCEGNAFVIRAKETDCGSPQNLVEVRIPESGSPIERNELELLNGQCVIGRMPDGCQLATPSTPRWESYVGFLSESAALEGASVPAFLMLAGDLQALAAPSELIDQAMRSANDEVRHAAMIASLSAQEGAESIVVEVPRRARKTLFEMARENAVEGCVRETYGALVGTYQAQFATDPAYRAAMVSIAVDETQHAELSHRVAAWAEPQLSVEERAEIHRERRQIIAGLRASATQEHAPEIYDRAGFPRPEIALAMLDSLEQNLWLS